jgi:hypothetical protein
MMDAYTETVPIGKFRKPPRPFTALEQLASNPPTVFLALAWDAASDAQRAWFLQSLNADHVLDLMTRPTGE